MTKINELQLGKHQDVPGHTTAIDETVARLNQVIRQINGLDTQQTDGSLVGPEGPQGPRGFTGATGLDGVPFVPVTVDFSVPEEAPGVWSIGETSVRKKAILFKISADQSCIVRLYNSAALRDSDTAAMRLPTTNPGPGIILAEVGLDLANDRMQFLAPTSVIYNADDPFTDVIYWAVQQTMVFDTEVNVELYLLPLEL